MTTKYYALLTNLGAAKMANAAALGTKIQITQMAVGDGGGTLPTPNASQTKLIGEKRRAGLNSLSVDKANSSQIIAEQVIPESEGGFWIREIGLFDADGVLIAVANCAETYKPQLQEGSGRTQTVRMIIIVSSTDAVTLKIDPSVVLATRQYVDNAVIEVKAYADDLMAKHIIAADPHSQYAPKKDPTLTGTPKAPTAAAAKNDTQIATTAFVQAVMKSHTDGTDPHSQYAPKKDPTFTGTPTAPTPEINDSSKKLATTEFVAVAMNESAPVPDFWMPLSDDMLMLTGQGPYDRINIGNQYVELATRSATFTRASTANYFDKTGFMVTAAVNEPRFEKPGLLMEGRATNLYTNSEAWAVGIGTIVTNNSAASPRGDNTAALLQEAATTGEHYVSDRNLPLTTGVSYCFSAFVSAAPGGRSLYIRVASGTSGGAIFDPVVGDWVGGLVGANATDRGFEYIGNGIYRVWVVINAAATQTSVIRLQVTNKTVSTYAGDGSSGVNVWGAQFEEGTFPTSYIKTDSAAVTRAADFWSVPVANAGYRTLAQQINRTVAFNIYPKFISSVTSEYVDVATVRGVRNDIFCRPNSGNRISAYRGSGGATLTTDSNAQGTYVMKTTGDTLTNYFANKSVSMAVSPVSTTETPAEITNSASTVAKFVYYIKNFRIWHSALTDNQIKGLR